MPGGGSLQFDQLIAEIRSVLGELPDRRSGKNLHYAMSDIALSAFSVFFMQSPSFLDFQRTMGRTKGRHNAASLFGVQEVPSDNHIRSVLDEVAPESLHEIFDSLLDRLQHAGILDEYCSIGNDVVVVLDGTEYYRSDRVHCPQCLVTSHSNGKTSYHHSLIAPAVVKAGRKDSVEGPVDL